MAKIVLGTVTGGYDLSIINNNFDKLEAALQNEVLYRNNPVGEPNTLETDLDANGKRIYNLPEPLLDSQAARLQDVQNALAGGAANLIEFTPYGTLAATNVQAAIQEIVDEDITASELSASSGSSLVGFIQSGVGATARTVQSKLRDFVSVLDFGADNKGVVDATTAFSNAVSTGKAVFVPAGTYILELALSTNGAYFFGEGVNSVLKPLTMASRGAITVNSASAVTFIDNLTFRDLKFLGSVVANGFSEQKHLLTLNGVRNVLVENCLFEGFRGDGLYIGSGDTGGLEKHNHNVTVKHCRFDGVNNDNRQGISIIDADGLLIEDCIFENITRSTMPGAIDIEPDVAAFHVVKNIKISKNKFKNIGGNLGVISLFLASSTIPAPDNILIEGNEFVSSVTSTAHAEIFLGTTRTLVDADIDMGIVIRDNRGRGGSRALDIRAVKGVDVLNNRFESYQGANSCGQAAANQAPRNIVYRDNRFIKCGTVNGIGLEIFSVDYLTLENTLFDDCGAGTAGSYAIDFNTGTSSHVALRNNTFRTPTAITQQGIVKEAGHTFTVATNTQIGDKFLNSLSNNFQAEESDIVETSYSPVVEGATTAGTGVYTTQLGRYQRLGKRVRFWVHVDVQAGHTGSGLIELSLPLPAKSQTPLIPISVLGAEGITNTERTAMGMLNTAATAGGVQGAVRMYANAAAGAAQTQLTIPAGAFKLWIQGEYLTT